MTKQAKKLKKREAIMLRPVYEFIDGKFVAANEVARRMNRFNQSESYFNEVRGCGLKRLVSKAEDMYNESRDKLLVKAKKTMVDVLPF